MLALEGQPAAENLPGKRGPADQLVATLLRAAAGGPPLTQEAPLEKPWVNLPDLPLRAQDIDERSSFHSGFLIDTELAGMSGAVVSE
ncbi:hypothetical protein BH09GEM1_BH09GEM1_44750 [soil metagenome]